jgi:ankyrin repeat protein
LSPLHLAILNGHCDVVELLVSEYGADVLLPVKLMVPGSIDARAAILVLVLAISLPEENAKAMAKLLLKLGASSAQADMNHTTALHYLVSKNHHDAFDIILKHDRPAALSVLSNLALKVSGYYWGGNNGDSPLTTAVDKGYDNFVSKLLTLGAKSEITFDDWIKGYLAKSPWAKNNPPEQNLNQFKTAVTQPIISAATNERPGVIGDLLRSGADANTLEKQAQ